jgi:hypothetical protein
MNKLLLLIVAGISPVLMAQSFDLGEVEEDKPAPKPVEQQVQEQPLTREVEVKPEPVAVQPAVDKYKNFRCSAGKSTQSPSAPGPLNDAEDLIIDLLGVGKPLNRKIVQADTNDPRRPKTGGESFSLSGQRGTLELGMPKGLFGAWVWVPAALCVTDNNELKAIVNASQHGMGVLEVGLHKHGSDSFRMSGGTPDGSIKFDGTYLRTMEEVRRGGTTSHR